MEEKKEKTHIWTRYPVKYEFESLSPLPALFSISRGKRRARGKQISFSISANAINSVPPPLPLASLVYEIFHKTGVAYRGTLSNFISTQIFVFLVILSLYLHRYKHWRMMARLSPSENTCGMLHRTCKLYRSAQIERRDLSV